MLAMCMLPLLIVFFSEFVASAPHPSLAPALNEDNECVSQHCSMSALQQRGKKKHSTIVESRNNNEPDTDNEPDTVFRSTEATPLIIDTDIGGGGCMDVDDVGAICLAHALEDNGEAKILAIVQSTSPTQGAGVISVLNHFYGRDGIPIGAYKAGGLNPKAPFLPYVQQLVQNWPSPVKNTTQVPSSVDVYRKALASQPDRSVVISCIGLLTNLAALLRSEPDEYSALYGNELVAQKVRLVAIMAGTYDPRSPVNPECNVCGCMADPSDKTSIATATLASHYVASHLPREVKVIWSGFEVGYPVWTGALLQTCADVHNPCREAYMNFKQTGPGFMWDAAAGRQSFDPLTTLVAVRGPEAVGCAECTDCHGVNEIDPETGKNRWAHGPASNQTYLILRNKLTASKALDNLYCQPRERDRRLE